MYRWIERLSSPWPMRNRLVASLVLFILFPFSLFQLYNYNSFELLIQQKISEQSQHNLQGMKRSLEDLAKIANNTFALIEQDSLIQSVLGAPGNYAFIDRLYIMEGRFRTINNSLFHVNPHMYYTVYDLQGNAYVSFLPKQAIHYESETGRLRELLRQSARESLWISDDPNYVQDDTSKSKQLATLYAVLKNPYKVPIGYARISFDYTEWFNSFTKEAPSQQYAIARADGASIISSRRDGAAAPQPFDGFVAASPQTDEGRSYIDKANERIVNYSYFPMLDWYLVNPIPLSDLFREVEAKKRSFFMYYALFTGLFLIVIVAISSALTKPLWQMKQTMSEAVEQRLKVLIAEDRSSKETYALSRTFNRMMRDMNQMVDRLKLEERQKEAVRFQVLLSQMNPHFLLNTLNTVKSLALMNKNRETHDICLSLGKLLETSLNPETDLIYLKQEIELVQAFVHIQEARFAGSIAVRYDFDEALAYALVPKLSLQPLVENCFVHGFWQLPGSGAITVKGYTDGKMLVLEVADNGVGLAEAGKASSLRPRKGIGVANIRERLQLLFKADGSLELLPQSPGTIARLRLPLLISKPYEGADD